MIQGTMSNAGKSLLVAGILRVLKQDGYRAAPFKSQNMALNSYITGEGLEMGRAQEIQEAINGTSLEDIVEVEFNSQYVQLNLSGAILFESGKAELVKEAYPTVDKIGRNAPF